MRVADFFCGGGGFSEGFRQAGFEIVFAVDKWTPAIDTYKGNKPGVNVILDDVIRISQLPDEEFEALVPDSEVIIGNITALQKNRFAWRYVKDFLHPSVLEDCTISLSSTIAVHINDKNKLNDALIISTVNQLFEGNLMDSSMFCYDSVQLNYAFKNELLPLPLSSVRNVLISQGFLIPLRGTQGTRFYISSTYDALVAKHCRERRKQLSLEQLKRQLERDELIGEKAELFVLEYEKKRLGLPLSEKIKRISEIDAVAGYDIVSFDSPQSQEPDRFIEVKAVSHAGFYWSKNEYEIAKLHGGKYYLYLVEISKVADEEYEPEIISNPALTVMSSCDWFIEPESYQIRKSIRI